MDLLAARPGLVLNTVEAERWSPELDSGCNHGLNEVTHAEASPGLSVHSSGYVLSSSASQLGWGRVSVVGNFWRGIPSCLCCLA